MIFFNMKSVEKAAGPKPLNQVLLIGFLAGLQKPTFFKGTGRELVGYSFLTNARPLCVNLELHDVNYIVQYIQLAARRDYALFKKYNMTTLDMSYYPDLAIDSIKHNPLININNRQIYFKYEEIYNGIKIRRNQG